MKIYVASSWRNQVQPEVVKMLRDELGHEVYDFRHPEPGDNGFAWSEIDPNWINWSIENYREKLKHPLAVDGFRKDMKALVECDVCILVLPCGRSAHLEAGYAKGAGKKLGILLSQDRFEPELMYKMADWIWTGFDELEDWKP